MKYASAMSKNSGLFKTFQCLPNLSITNGPVWLRFHFVTWKACWFKVNPN